MAAAELSNCRLQQQLAQAQSSASRSGGADQEALESHLFEAKGELKHFKEKAVEAEKAVSQLQVELAQIRHAASSQSNASQHQILQDMLETAELTVCRLQQELAQTSQAASSSSGSGQEKSKAESDEAKAFTKDFVDNCMSFVNEHMLMQCRQRQELRENEQ